MARQAVYTEQISAKVSERVKQRLRLLDRTYPLVSESDAIRTAMEYGMTAMDELFSNPDRYRTYLAGRRAEDLRGQITVYVPEALKAHVKAIEALYPQLAEADAVRVAIAFGLDRAEAHFAAVYPEHAKV